MKTKLEENILRMISTFVLTLFYIILVVIVFYIFKASSIQVRSADFLFSLTITTCILILVLPIWSQYSEHMNTENVVLAYLYI